MSDFYKITVEYPRAPLLVQQDFHVRTLADVQRVRTEASQNGYRIVRWEAVLVDTPAEITAEVLNGMEGGRAAAVA